MSIALTILKSRNGTILTSCIYRNNNMLKSKDAKYKILSMMFYGNLPDLKIRWHGQDAIRLQCNFLMEHGTSSPPILFIL